MIKLKPRLQMVAEMIRRDSRLADIGTDHAYLPAYLLFNRISKSAIAADLRKGPLKNAESTINSCGLSEKVQLRLSDGLSNIGADEVDDIVIAGMGGILIKDILEKCSWSKTSGKKFILQPQSHDEIIRKWLFENGFEILEESSCFEDEKAYICFSTEYTGKVTEHSDCEIMFGGYINSKENSAKRFAEKRMTYINSRTSALKMTETDFEELKFLESLLEEVKKCQL